MNMQKILVTGAFGQIGSELVPVLQKKYGIKNVIATAHQNKPNNFNGILENLEILDKEKLISLVKKYKINTIYHLVSILSAKGEVDSTLTWQVNVEGLKNILDLAVEYKLKVFWPSSIAVFGPTTPKTNTPQQTILEPTTMYGVTKVAGELLCHYYFLKYGVDIRSVRYPGIISYKQEPSGGTTDYAVAIFYGALREGKYECFVKEQTMLPMMYMDDAIAATLSLMESPQKKITIRTSYNLAAISFTAKQLEEEIRKHIKISVTYVPDHRQKIADSWPRSIDDSIARGDWGWKHKYDLAKMTKAMIEGLKEKFQ